MPIFTNSNEVFELLDPMVPTQLTHSFEDIEDLVVITMFVPEEDRPYSLHELETLRPMWKDQIIPYIQRVGTDERIEHRDCYLLTTFNRCFEIHYYAEAFHFDLLTPNPQHMRDKDMFFAESTLIWSQKTFIQSLLTVPKMAKDIEHRVNHQRQQQDLSPLDLQNPLNLHHLETAVSDTLSVHSQQVATLKDRLFFMVEYFVQENDLCQYCREEMREAFYDNPEIALAWRPGVTCQDRNCKGLARLAWD